MRVIFLIAFYVFAIPFLYGQDTTSTTSSLLWEISGKKVKSPSYLFGTMHLISADKFYYPEHLEEKLINSDILIMEIGGLQDQMEMMSKLFIEEGNLFDHFTEEQTDSLMVFMNKHFNYTENQVRTMFGGLKPIALMQVFSNLTFGETPKSYELSLESTAKKNEIAIKGLETVEEQAAIFDSISMKTQIEMVMSIVADIDKSIKETKELEEKYLSQDIDAIYKMIMEDSSGITNYENELLINRNIKWVPMIKKEIRKNKSFIAVGSGHLGGEKGLINLLREEGYTLTPIKF